MTGAYKQAISDIKLSEEELLIAEKAFKYCYRIIASTSLIDTTASDTVGGLTVKVRRYVI